MDYTDHHEVRRAGREAAGREGSNEAVRTRARTSGSRSHDLVASFARGYAAPPALVPFSSD
jgi:hypothetical protein